MTEKRPMIEVQDLRKAYGDVVAVDGVQLTAREGEIFGLLGPNGAGKSTTIGCVSGLLKPDSGHAKVMGHDVQRDPRAAKQGLGVVPQELALYLDLSARANLTYFGAAFGLSKKALQGRVEEVLEVIGLGDRADDKVEEFSGGMQRRLNFGCGIVHEPKVLLLDEPTVGVDPQSRVKLLDLVRAEASRGTCVLYTTHYMEEAQDLCDRLAIVDHGKVIAEGTLEELKGELGERDLLRLSGRFDPDAVRRELARLDGVEVEVVDAGEESVMLSAESATRHMAELYGALAEAGADVRESTLSQPNLESLFIKLTGRELRE